MDSISEQRMCVPMLLSRGFLDKKASLKWMNFRTSGLNIVADEPCPKHGNGTQLAPVTDH